MVTAKQLQKLNNSAKKGCKGTQFDDVSAEFIPAEDLKIKWMRCGGTINFMVVDYLRDAPAAVQVDLFKTLLAKMGGDMDAEYSQRVIDYLTGEKFREMNVETYLKRKEAYITETQKARIADSIARLDAKNLIPDNAEGLIIRASDRTTKPDQASVLMRVVLINPDVFNLNDDQFDAVLMHGILWASHRFAEKTADISEAVDAVMEAVDMQDAYNKAVRMVCIRSDIY